MREKRDAIGRIDGIATDVVLRSYFDELRLLQSEMDKRFERQANAFNLFVLVLGALLSGTLVFAGNAAAKGVPSETYVLVPAILVFVPWLTTPLAAMYFNDELMIGMTARYIADDLAPLIDTARSACFTGAAPSFSDGTLGGRLKRLHKPLNGSGSPLLIDPRRAVKVRAFLFVMPFVIAAVGFVAAFAYAPGMARYGGDLGRAVFIVLLCAGAVVDARLLADLEAFWENHRRMESAHAHERTSSRADSG